MPTQSPTPPENIGPIAQSQQRPTGEHVPNGNHARAKLVLRLKNGEQAEARLALIERDMLDRFLRTQPQHFEVLLKLCRDQTPPDPSNEAWRESIEVLKQRRSVLDDGTVRPLTRNVLLSSYQMTPDGPVLTQPFDLANKQDKQLADLVDHHNDENQMRFVRDILAGIDNDRSR